MPPAFKRPRSAAHTLNRRMSPKATERVAKRPVLVRVLLLHLHVAAVDTVDAAIADTWALSGAPADFAAALPPPPAASTRLRGRWDPPTGVTDAWPLLPPPPPAAPAAGDGGVP